MAIGEKNPVLMGAEKGQPNGVATLGADGKLAESQIPGLDVLGAAPGGKAEAHPFPFAEDLKILDTSGIFWKTAFGEVHLLLGHFGHISEAVFPNAWSTIGMLPEGYRPSGTIYGMCSNSAGVLSTLAVDGTGKVAFRPNAENQRYGGGVEFTFLAT